MKYLFSKEGLPTSPIRLFPYTRSSQWVTATLISLLKGGGAIVRITLAVAVACLSLGGFAAAGDATAAIRKQVDIPAEGLGPALNSLAKARDFQPVYATEDIAT